MFLNILNDNYSVLIGQPNSLSTKIAIMKTEQMSPKVCDFTMMDQRTSTFTHPQIHIPPQFTYEDVGEVWLF